MKSNSIVDTSPSFNTHSSNNLADIADRVVHELRTDIGFDDDIFDFGDDDDRADTGENEDVDTNSRPTGKLNENEEDAPHEDETEFEFPVVCRDSNLFPISTDEVLSDHQILPSYPLFDRSLLLDVDPSFSNGVDISETDSKSSRGGRLSLGMLLREEHSVSSSSSEADDLDGITPGTYCVWKPKPEPRGKHKKSNSVSFENTSKRWKVRDLLKRSYSDDNYSISTGKDASVVLFTPPIAPKQKINSEKVKKTEKTAKVASTVDGSGARSKTDNNSPVHKAKSGGNRLPPYLPYRPDQLALFANLNGSSRNMYRY
ncbi:hypothetical protein L1887_20233 [Cichorium endivia]|nr:hypothetical protein L1887_20233 [Cichorium endivia]